MKRKKKSSKFSLKQALSQKRLRDFLTPRLTKYIPHNPTPRQAAFLILSCLDALYGGSAGGGKSDALLMAALQFVDIPGYSALILRDTYKNLTLPGAIQDRAEEWLLKSDAIWSYKRNCWIFPSGATLTFGNLSKPKQHLDYKSTELQYIGIDEAVDIRSYQLRYMFSRLRKPSDGSLLSKVPLRMRLASNPGGISHEYLKKRYIKSKEKGEHIFIAAKLEDNPYLDTESYEAALEELDYLTRRQLRHGDWDVNVKGDLFERDWFGIVDIEPQMKRIIRYWDLAATEEKEGKEESEQPAYTVGAKVGIGKDGNFYIINIIRFRGSPAKVDNVVSSTAVLDGHKVKIGYEEEPGSSGKITTKHMRDLLIGYNFKEDRAIKNKVDRARPLSSIAEHRKVYIVRGNWNESFLDEIEAFPKGTFKDQVDAVVGAVNQLRSSKSQIRSSVV